MSPARDRIAYHERFTFRGSSGPPRCVVNTRPVSRHAGPAASWSPFCRLWYARSEASVGGGTGTTRRERAVFGSTKTRCPPTRCRAWRTVRVASPKSMSLQRRPSSSPFRRPRVRVQTHSASNRSPWMTPTLDGRGCRSRRLGGWPGVSPLLGGGPARCLCVGDARRGPPRQRRSPAPAARPATRRNATPGVRTCQNRLGVLPATGDPVAGESRSQGRDLRPRPSASLRADPGLQAFPARSAPVGRTGGVPSCEPNPPQRGD